MTDDLWDAAQKAKEDRGDSSLSEVIRRFLRRYIAGTPTVLAERARKQSTEPRHRGSKGSGQ